MLTHAQAVWARELIARGGYTIEAIHKLTGVPCKTISEMREAYRAGDQHFRSCQPWKCPTCGGALNVTPCVWCDGEQRRRREAGGIEKFVSRIVGRRIIKPRHPSFTSYG